MTVLSETNRQQITDIVVGILEIDPAELTDQSLFKDDHGADSLRAIEILAALEREFKVEINQAELSRMVNLQGIYQVIAEYTGNRE